MKINLLSFVPLRLCELCVKFFEKISHEGAKAQREEGGSRREEGCYSTANAMRKAVLTSSILVSESAPI